MGARSSFLAFLTVCSGCFSQQGRWDYSPGPRLDPRSKPIPARIVILPFQDRRGTEETYLPGLTLIPLCPFGLIEYDRPDLKRGQTNVSYSVLLPEEIARSVAAELQAQSAFREVAQDVEPEPGDLVLDGTIHETEFSSWGTTYGLSFLGGVFWYLGVPAGHASNSLDLSLAIHRYGEQVPIWQRQIVGEWGCTYGLYYSWLAEFDGWPKLLKSGMADVTRSLALEAERWPAGHWLAASSPPHRAPGSPPPTASRTP